MADTTTKTTTTPRRRTTAAKPATTKPAARKAATTAKPAPKEAAPAEAVNGDAPAGDESYVVELEFAEDTKSYAKFVVPENLKGTMVGALYVPHGTDTVKVKITSVGDDE